MIVARKGSEQDKYTVRRTAARDLRRYVTGE